MKQKSKFKQTEIGKIPEDWKFEELEKHAKIIMGQSPESKYYNLKGEGTPFLQGIRTFGSLYPNYDTWTTEVTKLAKYGSVLLSVRAPVGEVNIADKDVCIGRGLMSIDSQNNKFIFYLFKGFKGYVINKETGTVYGSVTRNEIAKLKFPFPEETEQSAIAKILSDLDSKIELNQQMNKTLEAIGQAIFKRWFVDFEFPNGKSKPYKSSGGEMVKSELGEIPMGWKVGKLGDFIEFVKGKKPSEVSETFVEGYLPQILIENLDGKEPVFADATKLTIVQETEPIMVMDGASSGRIEIGHKGILGSTLAKVVAKNNLLKNSYLLYFLKNYQEEINHNTTGTSIPHTDKERIKRFLITLPNKKLLELFDELANNILYTLIANKREIKSLATIRDSILPRLMSGKIRVPVEVRI